MTFVYIRKKDIHCTYCQVANFAQDNDLLSPRVIKTRNYASSHSWRAVVSTAQVCDVVCECSFERWCRETPTELVMLDG